MTQTRAITLNALSLYAVALVLAAAFAAQFILHELPCPLCLLQRILFAALAVGPILNIRFGPRPSHYAMSLLAAVAGAVASTRQVLLHIMPGDAGYGSALLGYHYYTWALLGFITAIVLLAAILLFDRQFEEDKAVLPATGGAFAQTAVWLVIALTAANVVTTLLECGFGACADNPLVYELLKRGYALRPLRNIEPALHRRPGEPAFQPCRHLLQRIECDEIARTVEADQVAHPAEHGNVGDGIFVVHDPLPSGKPRLHHVQQALRLGDVTLERPLVGKLLAGEFVEKADLPEHRPDPAHLEVQPLDGLLSPRRIGWQKLAGLLGEILQDRAGLEQRQRLAAGPVRIEDGRDLAVRIQRQEFRRLLVVLVEVDQMHLVGQSDLFQHDRDLDAVRRRQRIELEAVGMFGGPAFGDREGGEIGHRNSFCMVVVARLMYG